MAELGFGARLLPPAGRLTARGFSNGTNCPPPPPSPSHAVRMTFPKTWTPGLSCRRLPVAFGIQSTQWPWRSGSSGTLQGRHVPLPAHTLRSHPGMSPKPPCLNRAVATPRMPFPQGPTRAASSLLLPRPANTRTGPAPPSWPPASSRGVPRFLSVPPPALRPLKPGPLHQSCPRP